MELRYGSPEEVGMSAERIRVIEQAASRMVQDGITPAHVILAARKGVIVTHQAYGVMGPEPGAGPLAADALYPLCSITKVFTAACFMMLVERGLVGLNRPVVDYIPEFVGDGKSEVRIHHLLTHTSGIEGEDLHAHRSRKREQMTVPPSETVQDREPDDSLCDLYDVPLRHKPGKVMSYCGFGYDLLGEIICRTTGHPYVDFIRENLFEPLEMNDTMFILPDNDRHRLVRRPLDAPCAEFITDENFLRSESPAGGAISTALDLAKFGQLFLNKGTYNGKRILSPVSVLEMVRNQIPGVPSTYRDEYFPEAYWGYGWAVNGDKRDGGDLFSPQAYSHWGAAGVFICVDPVYETVHVYLSVELDHNKPFKNMYADIFNNTVLAAITRI